MSTLHDAIADARSRLDRAETWVNSAQHCAELGHHADADAHLAHAHVLAGEAYARLGRALFAPNEGPAPKAVPA